MGVGGGSSGLPESPLDPPLKSYIIDTLKKHLERLVQNICLNREIRNYSNFYTFKVGFDIANNICHYQALVNQNKVALLNKIIFCERCSFE